MAHCKKCGGGKLRKNAQKQFYCRRHGVQPMNEMFDRSGTAMLVRSGQDETVFDGDPYIIGTIRPEPQPVRMRVAVS